MLDDKDSLFHEFAADVAHPYEVLGPEIGQSAPVLLVQDVAIHADHRLLQLLLRRLAHPTLNLLDFLKADL